MIKNNRHYVKHKEVYKSLVLVPDTYIPYILFLLFFPIFIKVIYAIKSNIMTQLSNLFIEIAV